MEFQSSLFRVPLPLLCQNAERFLRGVETGLALFSAGCWAEGWD